MSTLSDTQDAGQIGHQYRIGTGTILNELYAVDSLIAVGGMGEVYRGHVIETGEAVAIKTIRPEFAQNADALTLFKKEAKALRKLYHDAIVRYFVFTVDRPSASPYLAMEFVEGQPLSDILRKGNVPFESLCVLLKRIASGLHAAHLHGIIHRDMSPDNIIIPDRDFAAAKIIDFGIARSHLGEATVVGSGFAGKFAYVSPEQLGLFGGDVTGRSDIYSLGLVLAQASLGRALDMGGSHVDVVEKRRRVPDLTSIDPRLRPLLQAMLQPNPKDRPSTMAAVAEWPLNGRTRRFGKGAVAASALVAVLAAAVGLGAAWTRLSLGLAGGTADEDRAVLLNEPPAVAMSAEPARPEPVTPNRVSPPSVVRSGGPLPRDGETRDPAPVPSGGQTGRGEAAPAVVAALPTGRLATPTATVEQVASFVREYKAGPCFHALPVSISESEAVVEAFGAAPGAFVGLDADLKKLTGSEPDLIIRQVSAAQCGVVDALAKQAVNRPIRSPKLSVRSEHVRAGGQLLGTIEARPDTATEVFLVNEGGNATSLSNSLRRAGDQVAFNTSVDMTATGGKEQPFLVVAVTTPRPLPGLKVATTRVDDLLRLTQDDAARSGQQPSLSVRYVKASRD